MTFHPALEELERHARANLGVIHRQHALAAGVSDRTIVRLVASGHWTKIHTNTFVPRPVPLSWETLLRAACVEGGETTVAAGRAALRLLEFPRYAKADLEVASPKNLRLNGVRCRKLRGMRPEDIVWIKGIPARRFEPTLLELCGDPSERMFCGALLDEALRRKLTHLRWLYRTCSVYGKRGRRGTRLFRHLVMQRDAETALTDSELESYFRRMSKLLSHKLLLHHVVRDEHGKHISEVDFAIPELQIAIPLNGYDPHSMRSTWDKDHRIYVLLQNQGWEVLPFTYWQVRNDLAWVLGQIEIAISQRSVNEIGQQLAGSVNRTG